MKRLIARPLALLLGLSALALGRAAEDTNNRPLLTLEEFDQDGGRHAFDAWYGPVIVDINSEVELEIDKDALRRSLNHLNPQPLPPRLGEDLEILQAAIENAAQRFDDFKAAMADPAALSEATLQSTLKSMAAPGRDMIRILGRTPRRRAALNEMLRAAISTSGGERLSITRQYELVFPLAREHLLELRQEFDTHLQTHGVYLQLGGWLRTGGAHTPLHLPGFDTNPVGTPFEYERFMVSLPEEEQQRFEAYRKASLQIRSTGIKEWLKTEFGRLPDFLGNLLLTNLVHLTNTLAPALATSSATLQAQVQLVIREVAGLRADVERLITEYREIELASPDQLLAAAARVKGDVDRLVASTQVLVDDLKRLVDLVKTEAQALETLAATTLQELQQTSKNTFLAISGLLITLDVDAANDSALEFTEAVFRHDIHSLPSNTRFSLIDTGPRKPGDSVTLRFAWGSPSRPGGPETLGTRRIQLYQPLWHSEVVAGLIFARTTESGRAVGNDFQPAPAISWLLKKDSRKSMFWNKLFDPGIGLNVTALDFDHDNTPEFGVGGVVSMFRDYVQAGGGYNINDRSPYFFFGLRIPLLPSLQISGAKNTE